MKPCVWKDFSGERIEREKDTGKQHGLNCELKSGDSQKGREIPRQKNAREIEKCVLVIWVSPSPYLIYSKRADTLAKEIF